MQYPLASKARMGLFEVDLSAHFGKVEQNRRHPLQAGGFLFTEYIFCRYAPFSLEICLRGKLLGAW